MAEPIAIGFFLPSRWIKGAETKSAPSWPYLTPLLIEPSLDPVGCPKKFLHSGRICRPLSMLPSYPVHVINDKCGKWTYIRDPRERLAIGDICHDSTQEEEIEGS
jgi:hypothetical protein